MGKRATNETRTLDTSEEVIQAHAQAHAIMTSEQYSFTHTPWTLHLLPGSLCKTILHVREVVSEMRVSKTRRVPSLAKCTRERLFAQGFHARRPRDVGSMTRPRGSSTRPRGSMTRPRGFLATVRSEARARVHAQVSLSSQTVVRKAPSRSSCFGCSCKSEMTKSE
eukprot:6191016-Pleurochrysis_carterae.AAC.1